MALTRTELEELEQGWAALCMRLGITSAASARMGRRLVTAWQRWPRCYHAGSHLLACVRAAEAHRAAMTQPDQVLWALWFHDAIYWPWRRDNELRSAVWARDEALRFGLGRPFADAVHALVMDTCHGVEPAPGDPSWLVDIDLGVLGQSAEAYGRYARDVRREYFWVPAARFAQGRAAVLRGFLARPHLYSTAFFRDTYEAQARRNMADELQRLAP
jgi:predicted metal-dependent HD superfamily phosphohydrolase